METLERRLALMEHVHALAERQRIAALTPAECEDELSEIEDRLVALAFIQRLSDNQLESLTEQVVELHAMTDAELRRILSQYEPGRRPCVTSLDALRRLKRCARRTT